MKTESCIVCNEGYDTKTGEEVLFEVFDPLFKKRRYKNAYESLKAAILREYGERRNEEGYKQYFEENFQRIYHYCGNCEYLLDPGKDLRFLVETIEDFESFLAPEGDEEIITSKFLLNLEGRQYINYIINKELEEISTAETSMPQRIKEIVASVSLKEASKEYFKAKIMDIWKGDLEDIPDVKSQICRVGGMGSYIESLFRVSCDNIACILLPINIKYGSSLKDIPAYMKVAIPSKYKMRQKSLRDRIIEDLNLKEPDLNSVIEKQLNYMFKVERGFSVESIENITTFIEDNFLNEKEGMKKAASLKQDSRYVSAGMIYVGAILTDVSITQADISDELGPTESSIRNNCKKLEAFFPSVDWEEFESRKARK